MANWPMYLRPDYLPRMAACERVKQAVSESSARTTLALPSSGREDNDVASKESKLKAAGQVWVIGAVLLGSGAERRKAEVKQELSKQLVVLGSAIIHYWTEERIAFDFGPSKAKLTSDEGVHSFIEIGGKGEKDFYETRKLVGLLVDAMEFSLLSQPFRWIMDYLCEQARHRVLGNRREKGQFRQPH